MRVYWLRFETIFGQVMVEADGKIRECKVFEIMPEQVDRVQNQRSLKKAWRYIENLAKNYARRHNLTAIYAAHPDRLCAAWIVQ